ncbi:hypothetical protein FNL39_102362 [Nocardia caishijiensis]|uniref:Ribbon-helix-helix CopG family protein n=2 Tax=Nocardia caishijiensis TaxID=184756 RepID=A0ABQ6YR25_9NOCA|nr:hypothetical protein FNL39_102362 [Nocardia caishijiensis]
MARKSVEIDGATLAEAARYLETATDSDTVEAALREVIDRGRRIEAIARMRALIVEGEINSTEADDLEAFEDAAAQSKTSEAEIIREAIRLAEMRLRRRSEPMRLRRFASEDPNLAARSAENTPVSRSHPAAGRPEPR